MASDQATAASIIIYAESPSGNRKKVFEGVNEQTGPGGSPDGAQATVKDNELPFMPLSRIPVPGGAKLILSIKLGTADGLDASDSVINVPVRDNSGNTRYLTRTDFGYTTDFPASTPAGTILDLGAGYTVPEGQVLFVGGNKYFMSVENDTA